jgi:hypothetical protein
MGSPTNFVMSQVNEADHLQCYDIWQASAHGSVSFCFRVALSDTAAVDTTTDRSCRCALDPTKGFALAFIADTGTCRHLKQDGSTRWTCSAVLFARNDGKDGK